MNKSALHLFRITKHGIMLLIDNIESVCMFISLNKPQDDHRKNINKFFKI